MIRKIREDLLSLKLKSASETDLKPRRIRGERKDPVVLQDRIEKDEF